MEEKNKTNTSFQTESGLTIEEIPDKDSDNALAAKVRGNTLYGEGKYEEAIECYTEAIEICPEGDSSNLAVYYSNRAACHLMLGNHEVVVQDCTASLELKEGYAKALSRRCKAFEHLEKYFEATEDARKLVELKPDDREAARTLQRVEKKMNKQHEEQKDEMIGKLKDLGNGILGKFGLSLDNFQATQDPNTGSYSINFNQNPKP